MGTLCTNLDPSSRNVEISRGFFPRSKPDLSPGVGDTTGLNLYVSSSAPKARFFPDRDIQGDILDIILGVSRRNLHPPRWSDVYHEAAGVAVHGGLHLL